MEIEKKKRIILGTDYFSRKLFATLVDSKKASKILNFIKKAYSKFQYQQMPTDNGREFDNKFMKDYMVRQNVEHQFSVMYIHRINSRIERVNRTIEML